MLISDVANFMKNKDKDDVKLITLHWTVGTYTETFLNDYHFQILGDGSFFMDPRAFDSQGNFTPLAHSWHHNTANLGISVCGMYEAYQPKIGNNNEDTWLPWPSTYGKYPPTDAQMTSMIQLTALLVKHYNLTIDKVKSHYDLAQEDGYPGERWEWRFEKLAIIKRIQQLLELK